MILNKYIIITLLFTTLFVVGQHETCSSPSTDGYADLNTIGKCAIEKFKKSNKKEYVQISTRNRYVRRKSNTYLTKLKSNLSSVATKKVIRTIDNVDHLPSFFNCNVVTKEEEVTCFKDEIHNYISSNLEYPQEFLNKGVEDKVLTTFTINTNGYVTNIKTESSKGISALENEAKRLMNNLPQLKPAKYAGTVTEIRHKVYVNFDLTAVTSKANKPSIDIHNEGYIKNFVTFDQVTEKPIFITCADYGVDVRQECIKETIMHDVLDNLTYPFDAAAEGIEGRVWVRFVIDKDGYVTNITTSGPTNGVLLEEEAERLVKLLPKFLPGKHNGDYVNVEYFIPIDFHLDD